MTTADNTGNSSGEIAPEKILTPAEAAQLKEVARTTVYKAVAEGTLAHTRILGRIALRESDVLAWSPSSQGGARNLKPMTDAAKEKLSQSQKERWDQRKKQN